MSTIERDRFDKGFRAYLAEKKLFRNFARLDDYLFRLHSSYDLIQKVIRVKEKGDKYKF